MCGERSIAKMSRERAFQIKTPTGWKTALRVLDSMEEAEEWKEKNGGDSIEIRPGEDKKCIDYCNVCEFCNYYKEKVIAN